MTKLTQDYPGGVRLDPKDWCPDAYDPHAGESQWLTPLDYWRHRARDLLLEQRQLRKRIAALEDQDMRRKPRLDDNHTEIRKRFEAWDCTVESLASMGGGVPDLLVGLLDEVNLLVEVKDGSKSPSRRRLTEDEQRWHREWKGQSVVVSTVDQVDRLIEGYRQRKARRFQDALTPRRDT